MKHFAPPAAPAPRRGGKLRQWLFGAEAELEEPEDGEGGPATASAEALSESEILTAMISEACAAIAGTARLVRRSGDDARAYSDALSREAERLEAADPAGMVERLVSLTQAMVERTNSAEARLAAMAAEMDALEATLAETRAEAERDALTGLPNRRATAARLEAAMTAAAAGRAVLSLAYCDVDHFKRINDEHGHDVGDRVLKMVADTLAAGAGECGHAGRHGGEEFVVILERADAAQAIARIDAIRMALSERSFRSRTTGETIGRVTFSAGVAEWREGESGDTLLARADAALYRAKSEGRNRVIEG